MITHGERRPAAVSHPRLSRRTLLGIAGAAAVAGVPGCRSTVSHNDTATGSKSGTAAAPKRGGELTIAQVDSIDPISPLSQAIYAQCYRRGVFDTLLDIDPTTKQTVPVLATKWAFANQNKTVTLTVRDGVSWHSGRSFDAHDVAFTIDKSVHDKPPFPFAWMFADMTGLDVLDPKTVRISFATPKPNLTDALSLMIMIDKESYKDFRLGTAHVGTGPFLWDKLVPNTSLRIKRNPKYWRPDRPYLDSVSIRTISQTQALSAAVRARQVDVGLNLLPLGLAQIESSHGYEVTRYVTYGAAFYVGANVKVKPLDNPTVRQAINYAVDRDRINAELYKGQAKATPAPWSPISPAYDPSYASRYRRNIGKAKQLLATAGASGAKVAVEVSQNAAKIADIVAFNLGEIGLKAATTILTHAVGSDRFNNHSYQGIYIAAHGYNTLAPADLVYGAAPYRPQAGVNLFNFNNDKYRQLAHAAAIADTATQKQAWTSITEFILDQAFCCDLVQTTNNAVTHGVTGWRYNTWDELLLTDAYLG